MCVTKFNWLNLNRKTRREWWIVYNPCSDQFLCVLPFQCSFGIILHIGHNLLISLYCKLELHNLPYKQNQQKSLKTNWANTKMLPYLWSLSCCTLCNQPNCLVMGINIMCPVNCFLLWNMWWKKDEEQHFSQDIT